MSPHARCLVLALIALVLTQIGCNKASPTPVSPAPAPKVTGSPPTEAEAQEFADQMIRAVAAKDAAAIDQMIRMEDIAERCISDLELPTGMRQGFLKGLAASLKQASMGQQILQRIEGAGSYKLLRIRMVDGRPRPLFRLIHSDGGLNYHEFTLVRQQDGKVVAEDVFVYATGEPLSQTIRQLTVPSLVALQNQGGPGKTIPPEVKNMETIAAMGTALRKGDFQSAVTLYRTMPKKSQEQKTILFMYMQATMNLGAEGEADYLAAMQLYRQLFPDDAAINFISIDYFSLQKRFDEVHKSIDRLDQAVGGDPYLNLMRGQAWTEKRRSEEAHQAIEKAIEQEPDLVVAHWNRIGLSLQEEKHTDTLKWLQAIVEKCHVRIGELNKVPDYAEFVKSPQYAEWKQWYDRHLKGSE